MLPVPDAETDAGFIVPDMVLVHANVVPPIVAVGTKLKGCALQIC